MQRIAALSGVQEEGGQGDLRATFLKLFPIDTKRFAVLEIQAVAEARAKFEKFGPLMKKITPAPLSAVYH